MRIFQERFSGSEWIGEVVEDGLDLPEVADPLASCSFRALFYAFIGSDSLSVKGKLHCNLNVFAQEFCSGFVFNVSRHES